MSNTATPYSIQRELGPSCTILITGGTGFVGSAVAEAILRTTDARVLVLLRRTAVQSPESRLSALLERPLFRLLKEQQAHKLARIEVVQVRGVPGLNGGEIVPPQSLVSPECQLSSPCRCLQGDMLQEGLGLSSDDLARIQQSVNIIVHSAASIELDADMQESLKVNFEGTRRVGGMQQLGRAACGYTG